MFPLRYVSKHTNISQLRGFDVPAKEKPFCRGHSDIHNSEVLMYPQKIESLVT